MYLRKASLDHRPIIMIEKVGTPARYMAMAAPDRTEWVPMSSDSKPNLSSPTPSAAERSLFRTVVEEMVESLSSTKMVLTGVFSSVPGYEMTRRHTAAHDRTGHKTVSPERCMVTDSCLSSFFWNSKVMVTVSDRARFGLLCETSRPFLKKRIFLIRIVLVLRFSSAIFVRRYSHERIAKKMAPINNCAIAIFYTVDLRL